MSVNQIDVNAVNERTRKQHEKIRSETNENEARDQIDPSCCEAKRATLSATCECNQKKI
jgi:hypothetical protein